MQRRNIVRTASGALLIAATAVGVLYGCASAPADRAGEQRAAAMLKSSFKTHGQATLERLDQDETQRLCSEYAGRALPQPVAERIQKANLATIHLPADGKLVGDWKSGEKMFYYRGGTHDFACTTCHGDDGKRIRLQDLPNLTKVEGAQKAYTTWPAYRVSQGELRTFQWRLNDCFRQQRFPELVFGSDASIALTTYLAGRANGAEYNGPAIKR